MKLLDAAEERILLLCAPAGYGKTTLARQWAKTVNRVAWVSCTPAHRDVVVFAEDLAAEIERLGGAPLVEFQTYVRARPNPQSAARDIAIALAKRLNEAHVQWLIVDDYHELAEAPQLAEAFALLVERAACRVVVSSRVRPAWATPRRALYGELFELDRQALTMDLDESAKLVGGSRGRERLFEQAQGWAAALALAASPRAPELPADSVPDTLYQFLAEELFSAAGPVLRDRLIEMALLPETSRATLRTIWADADDTIEQARDIGFLALTDEPELHPLIRDFLLRKLGEEARGEDRVRTAVAAASAAGAWPRAFELILRFGLTDLLESTLEQAYRPLVGRGRIGTLVEAADAFAGLPAFPPPIVDLIHADLANRTGNFSLATRLADSATERFLDNHPLRPRSLLIAAQSQWAQMELGGTRLALEAALKVAEDDNDVGEALYGLALLSLHGQERKPEPEISEQLSARRRKSPTDLLRWAALEVLSRRMFDGVNDLRDLDEAMRARSHSTDARVRTAFAASAAYALILRAEYGEALAVLADVSRDIEDFELQFVQPHVDYNIAYAQVGLRRLADANRSVERIQRVLRASPNDHHRLNVQIMRARISIAMGRSRDAADICKSVADGRDVPSTLAEVDGLLAVSLAACGVRDEAEEAIEQAERASRACEIRALTAAARSICAARARNDGAEEVFEFARDAGIVDAIVTAVRASRDLLAYAAQQPPLASQLADLFRRSRDYGLARRAGIHLTPTADPNDVLSAREMEVLGLIAQGLRNRDISEALYITESTTKIHVRHIFDKLGVRSRAEAAARYNELSP